MKTTFFIDVEVVHAILLVYLVTIDCVWHQFGDPRRRLSIEILELQQLEAKWLLKRLLCNALLTATTVALPSGTVHYIMLPICLLDIMISNLSKT